MEGLIAKWYARNTAKSMDSFAHDARRAANQMPPDAAVLEVAPGPGYFAIELAKLGAYRITGLDISRTFVEIAQHNAAKSAVKAEFRWGSASAMPFENGQFDFVFCRAAFKNFSEPVRALQEMQRVLKAGGRAWIIDLRRNASLPEIEQEVTRLKLGSLDAWLTRMAFRHSLLKRAYTKAEFEKLLRETSFSSIDIVESGCGMDIRLQKAA